MKNLIKVFLGAITLWVVALLIAMKRVGEDLYYG